MKNIQMNRAEAGQACWRKIGIWGHESARCEKLKFVTHCRNCEVFKQTVQAETAESQPFLNASGELVEKNRNAGDKSFIPFRLGNYCVAVPSNAVLTISDKVAIHSIPHNTNPTIKGLVAINHEVYTFIALEQLLDIETRKLKQGDAKLHSLFIRTLVVNFSDRIVVFYVDEVYPIYRCFEKNILTVNEVFDIKFVQGTVGNQGPWCGHCHLLDMSLISNQLAMPAK